MVYVNSQKFACESCIKGHRSSSCAHTDRPLFEIKKKGRPVSQCDHCRELRRQKRVHSKCTCTESKSAKDRPFEKAIGTKQKRYIPIVPALPNGLKDAFPPSSAPSRSSDPRQKVDSLLNPCPCADVWNCQCRASSSAASPDPEPSSAADENMSNGLATLARAAAALCCDDTPEPDTPSTKSPTPAPAPPSTSASPPAPRSCKHHRPPSPPLSHRSHKRTRKSPSPGPALPPLVLPPPDTTTQSSPYPYSYSHPYPYSAPSTAMPPFSTLTSLAGSGCTCGLRCACAGCAEHRPAHPHGGEADGARDCGDGCGDCVDEGTMSIDLSAVGCGFRSVMSQSASTEGSSTALESFFAYAARVPPPGGPVALPKLCCGGDCGCGSRCACGSACGGCCSEKADEAGGEKEKEAVTTPTPVPVQENENREERRASCCC
ncbi:hypothetical protein DENSPDRAFT_464247 [Dentipellis sp. KUC8613]|nr:hypothetical protein DENSPDRAFT_464247 [Dentipellis sp. KUC8613]